uniref:Uncharacterized protein n=1 Tax=Meloidogyne hapla TaxID=6305 RepID=A0A1I8BJF8_MELHA
MVKNNKSNPMNITSRKSRDSSEIEKSHENAQIIPTKTPLEKSHADPCLLRCKDEYMFYTSTTNTKSVRRDTFAIGSPLNALVI